MTSKHRPTVGGEQGAMTRRKFVVAVTSGAVAGRLSRGSASDRSQADKQTGKRSGERHFAPATERTPAIARYQRLRFGMFIHFTIKTFVDGPFWDVMRGPLAPADRFAPSKLDVDQWIRTARAAGMRYAVLTAKHYLGFALWDSRCTDYDIGASPVSVDIVERFVTACRKYGLAPGLYYALGADVAHRRDKKMNEAEYFDHARKQITELLSNYGPVLVMWFDAMGKVPPERWRGIYETVKSLQPDCLVVTNHGHGSNGTRIRFWPTDVIGAERTLPPPEGHDPWMSHKGKKYYIPMETCDTSAVGTFSKGWFWEPGEQMKEVQRELLPLYRRTTERHANLLLNVAIDREGRVPAAAAQRLAELGQAIQGISNA
ncbi:MAG: alpha-L-fucosidase [Planctomycetes bacterium]|nr:alpha-L-fucosidase [Planctomycetota bacterium]